MTAIRKEYEDKGVTEFYKNSGESYINPHEPLIAKGLKKVWFDWRLPKTNILDLACGSGEISRALHTLNCKQIIGCDPYTFKSYQLKTGYPVQQHSFEDISAGKMGVQRFKIIVCSYAMHLIEESKLPLLLYNLSQMSPLLLIVSPHKKPELKSPKNEIILDRIHFKLYEF